MAYVTFKANSVIAAAIFHGTLNATASPENTSGASPINSASRTTPPPAATTANVLAANSSQGARHSAPANPTNQTSASFSFTDTEAGVSFLCQLDGSAFSACSSPQSYSGLSAGSHTFSVKAQDAAGTQSTAASFTWTVDTTPPPTPSITSAPAAS